MHLRLVPALVILVMICACQGQPPPQIRFGDIGLLSERMELSSEITKALIRHGFGNEIVVVPINQSNALDGLLAQNFDVALFVQDPQASGVPSFCSDVSNEAVAVGPICTEEKTTKVVRCDLAKKDPGVFNLLTKIKVSPAGLNDALRWKQDNNATVKQSALYYLRNNRTGAFGYSAWMSDDHVQNVKGAIAKEMERSQLRY